MGLTGSISDVLVLAPSTTTLLTIIQIINIRCAAVKSPYPPQRMNHIDPVNYITCTFLTFSGKKCQQVITKSNHNESKSIANFQRADVSARD